MALALTANEIVDALQRAGHPQADEIQKRFETLANESGALLAEHLGVQHKGGTFDLGDVQVVFTPAFDGQECPEILADFDDPDEWDEDAKAVPTP